MRYLALLFALSAWLAVHAQDTINTGLNGDLEIRDYSVGDLGIDDTCSNMIDHALNWHSTANSPDYIDPVSTCRLSISYVHQGHGAGYFVAAGGASEFCHTQAGIMQAGHTYQISFWLRRDAASQPISQVGVTISSSPPVVTTEPSYSTSVDPIMTFKPTSTQYVQYNACYTATVNGMHYFGIGPHGGLYPNIHDLHDNSGFMIDDLVVTEMADGALFPTASITTAQPAYCITDTVFLDASGSTNVTSYTWEIVSPQDTSFHYQPGIQQGSPGVLNFRNIVPNPQRGVCYKATLQVYGICTVSTEIEFCFENPTVPFVSYNSACASTPLNIVINGDDGWHYIWTLDSDTLASDTGQTQITVMPPVGSSSYHVYFTTPEGCTGTQTVLVNASNPNNLPPTMNGINGTGEYTIYVQQGGSIDFTSLLDNDHLNEFADVDQSTPPAGANVTPPSAFGSSLHFSWLTNPLTPIGEYHYILTVSDQNACATGIDTFNFKIVVICNYCPICIDFEDRTPSNNPLPVEQNAGQCIKLGLTATTETGTASVVYHAGEYFEMGDYFEAGPGFEAIIASSTCTTHCDDCCMHFDTDGLTVDIPLPDMFTPGESPYPVWYIHDNTHPYCAFGSTGFELYIVDRWGVPVYTKIDYPGIKCCPYTSEEGTPTAISWDGHINVGTGQGNLVTNGVYFFLIYLHGCGQTQELDGSITIFSEMPINQEVTSTQENTNAVVLNQQNQVSGSLPDDHFYVFPNPTKDFVRVHSGRTIQSVFVLDEHGKVLLSQFGGFDQPISLSSFSAGRYLVKATFEDGSTDEKSVVKE